MTVAPKRWNAHAILGELTRNSERLRASGVRSIGLFGSYRHGTAQPQSDLDILVDLERPSFDGYMDLKFWLEDTFGCPVDLVLADTIKPRLRRIILSEVVYAEGLSALPGGHAGSDRPD